MYLLDLTLATPEQNLALDEHLLDLAERDGAQRETLRLWESPTPLVVIGRSSQMAVEVQQDYCRAQGIPVLRRSSGGAAIVAGSGCLMYAVVLSYETRPQLRAIDEAHAFVLDTVLASLRPLVPSLARRGTSDLAIRDRKVSGNSLRCKRRAMLYHGTLLYDFDVSLIPRALKMPPRQPDYRAGRDHESFVTNLSTSAEALRQAITTGWNAREPCAPIDRREVQSLVVARYACREWNEQR